MTVQPVSIRYPRKPILRNTLRFMGRGLMSLLARPTVNGLENLPKDGPLILVGNHVAMLEAVMMVLYVPWLIELLGTGEIPMDPRYAPIINTYGYIPIRRGDMDREALNAALDVLKQGGVVGIFPEGGIWESAMKKGRTGVAWLSYQANAPIVPIGFGGVDGAIKAVTQLKRPRLVMNIGETIPAVRSDVDGKSRKEALQDAANHIMTRIEALIPEEDKRRWNRIRDERFELKLTVQTADGKLVSLPDELALTRPDMLSKFFHRPLMLDVFSRNLKLPVQPLQHLDTEHDGKRLADATQAALGYLDTNPHFLTYRFGYDEGAAMQVGLKQLHDIGRWAEQNGYKLSLTPIRRYRRRGSDEEIVEDRPGGIPAL
ncbi:MAG: 1-acyl-sn-glycerol-3-phosphate acyltransferase [Anaerolineae bacterium]|nr:1-acyl-sn-glycerol-3-phosphate acyltransferase [Anaerolineae bacterium]